MDNKTTKKITKIKVKPMPKPKPADERNEEAWGDLDSQLLDWD